MNVTESNWKWCFLCTSQTCRESGGNKLKKFNQIHKILLKYLLSSSEILNESLYSQVLKLVADSYTTQRGSHDVTFCRDCNDLAESVAELQLQLEVIQMKLVEKLKTARKSVISNFLGENFENTRMLENIEDVLKQREHRGEDCESERKFLDVITQVHKFVFENDGKLANVPLLFLEKCLVTQGMMSPQLRTPQSTENTAKSPPTVPFRVVVLETIKEESESRKVDVDNNYDDDDDMYFEPHLESDTDAHLKTVDTDDNGDEKTEVEEMTPSQGKRKSALRATQKIKQIAKMIQPLNPKKEKRTCTTIQKPSKTQSPQSLSKKSTTKQPTSRRKHINIPSLKCDLCPFKTTEICKLEHHLKQHETNEKSLECQICQLKFTQEQSLQTHLVRHKKYWRCDICSNRILQAELLQHLDSHKTKVFNCDLCDRPFGNFRKLMYHSIHHPESKLVCGECPEATAKEFNVRHDLPRHMCEQHGHTDLKYPCPAKGCSEYFFNRSNLSNHQKYHGRHACDICQKACLSLTSLASHKILEHDFPKLECKRCPGKQFSHINSLKMHNAVQHGIGKLRYFKCSMCPRQFPAKNKVKMHELTHSSVKSFTCEVCGFQSHTKGSLKDHMVRHEGERRFSCNYCPQKFYRKADLRVHVRIHTNEKPFQCDRCGASYRSKWTLSRHIKSEICVPAENVE